MANSRVFNNKYKESLDSLQSALGRRADQETKEKVAKEVERQMLSEIHSWLQELLLISRIPH